MVIFDGKKISEVILERLKSDLEKRERKPGLGVLLVGNNKESELYVRKKREVSKRIGINFFLEKFDENIEKEKIIEKIKEFNNSKKIDGIIVQLPLPSHLNPTEIISQIVPEKDVDGFHPENRKMLRKGEPRFIPPLLSAIGVALQQSLRFSSGGNIIALVKSDVFSEGLYDFLRIQGIGIKTLIFSRERIDFFKKEMKKADIIISVLGIPSFIKRDFVKNGVALIDAGTRVVKGKVKGDVDEKSVKDKASFLTPVPGGIGPLVVAFLFNNVYLSATRE